MLEHFQHGGVELGRAYYIVVVPVHLCHDLVPNSFVFLIIESRMAEATVEDSAQLIRTDLPIAILVEHLESHPQVVFGQ